MICRFKLLTPLIVVTTTTEIVFFFFLAATASTFYNITPISALLMTHNPPLHYPVPTVFEDLPYLTKDSDFLTRDQFVNALYQSCNAVATADVETNSQDDTHHDPMSAINLKVQLMNGCKKELSDVINSDCGPDKPQMFYCINGFIASDIKNGIFDPVEVSMKQKNGNNIGVMNKARHDSLQGDPVQKLLDVLKQDPNTKKMGDTLQNDPITKKGKKEIEKQDKEQQQQQIIPTPPPSSFY